MKMVHNGIEYGDMQLICEAYSLLKDGMGLNHERMSEILAEWNKGELDSFLIEISAKILGYKDVDGTHLVKKIRDSAGQKGTYRQLTFKTLKSTVSEYRNIYSCNFYFKTNGTNLKNKKFHVFLLL